MPSCLGFYTDKNMIKYAKVNRDKTSNMYSLETYGVKFYENITTTIDEIAAEVGMDQCTVALTLNNEGYHSVDVFSGLKLKDRNDLIESEFAEYCSNQSLIPSALELRHQLVQNTGSPDKLTAICTYVSKSELANINTNFEGFKISSIAPIGLSVENLFRNKGIDEEAVIVNIENKTTVTLMLRNEVQEVFEIPLGMEDVLDKLAEKYNSYTKAYEACKKVSVYIDDVTSLDEESRDILDVVLPVLYDIRQRVDEVITPYKRLIKAIYLSGTAIIVNNVDLYFQENFPSLRCEIVKPFFLSQKDRGAQKEIIEVNTAIAIALNGLGMVDPSIDFSGAAKKVMRMTPIKNAMEQLNLSSKITNAKESVKEFAGTVKSKINKPKTRNRRGQSTGVAALIEKIKAFISKKTKGKVRVAFDAEVNGQGGDYVGSSGSEGNGPDELTVFDAWLIRLAVACVSIFIIYFGVSSYVTKTLQQNIMQSDSVISKVKSEILKASGDADYIRTKASEYSEKITKLTAVMEEIETEKRKSTFDIPNFMSQVMFIIPQGVSISNINISEFGEVEVYASSPQYAQLGYFVSRLKLEGILLNVDMTVIDMEDNIRIKIGGMLP